MTTQRTLKFFGIIFLCVIALAFFSLANGPAGNGWGMNHEWFWLRFPRVLAALAAGFALGIGGATQQGLFRNPLADPGLTGVFGGSLLGIATLLAINDNWVWEHSWSLPASAFAGAMITSLILVLLNNKNSTNRLILVGLGLNAFTAAGTLIIATRFSASRDILISGMTGDWLGMATLELIFLPTILCGIASLLLLTQARALDKLSLGEEMAQSLGVNLYSTRYASILLTALAAAAATCLVGQVAFIGLLAPHFARALVGPRHALVMPLSGLLGGGLLLLADTLGRSVWPQAPLSAAAMTAVLGAPAFVWIASRQND
ncbi:MAG: iron ABC transporter permease [bacterium]